MAVGEHARHELYRRLEAALGTEATTTLMAYLPPTGWADVATKQDVNVLQHELTALESRVLAEFHRELAHQTRTFVLGVVGLNVSLACGALALALVIA